MTKSEIALQNSYGWLHDAERYVGSRKEMRLKKAERMLNISNQFKEKE